MLGRITIKRQWNNGLLRQPAIMTASCLAAVLLVVPDDRAIAQDQDSDALLHEVQAILRQPLPAPPDGVTLPPTKSDEELAQQLRAMLFGNEAAGPATPLTTRASQPPAGATPGAGATQSAPAMSGTPATAMNPLVGQIRVELPPAPPERYAPSATQRRPAQFPDPEVIPLPPHPPEAQAPSAVSRPPIALPRPAAPLRPRPRLPDPTVIPLPPHPPEEQAPWRQGE